MKKKKKKETKGEKWLKLRLIDPKGIENKSIDPLIADKCSTTYTTNGPTGK
ncbi:hypothetical protein RDWZM_003196 [Blomia tropicalis]|uniref:Uncharacterized protein n=1 Tax=Blomia tropicalis TaxID=40697 RepID=A0A9Q0RSU1_BLOTA|nr:hypothetical protein RDWZM_003196 [Blomia tropicalis]